MSAPKTMSRSSIEGLIAAPIEVRTINGIFQVAQSVFCLQGRQDTFYRLEVESTHRLMMEFVKDEGHFEVLLIKWVGHRGHRVDVPDALQSKVVEMRAAATLSDDAARSARAQMIQACENTWSELGITRDRARG